MVISYVADRCVKPRLYWMLMPVAMHLKTKKYPFNVSFHLRDERKVQLQFFCVISYVADRCVKPRLYWMLIELHR